MDQLVLTKEVNLSHNQLVSLDECNMLQCVNILDASNNNLRHITQRHALRLCSLQELSLSNNSILLYISNRKRFPCFHRLMVTRVKFGRTRNAVETRAQTFTSVTITLWKLFCFFIVKWFEPIGARVIVYILVYYKKSTIHLINYPQNYAQSISFPESSLPLSSGGTGNKDSGN